MPLTLYHLQNHTNLLNPFTSSLRFADLLASLDSPFFAPELVNIPSVGNSSRVSPAPL